VWVSGRIGSGCPESLHCCLSDGGTTLTVGFGRWRVLLTGGLGRGGGGDEVEPRGERGRLARARARTGRGPRRTGVGGRVLRSVGRPDRPTDKSSPSSPPYLPPPSSRSVVLFCRQSTEQLVISNPQSRNMALSSKVAKLSGRGQEALHRPPLLKCSSVGRAPGDGGEGIERY